MLGICGIGYIGYWILDIGYIGVITWQAVEEAVFDPTPPTEAKGEVLMILKRGDKNII